MGAQRDRTECCVCVCAVLQLITSNFHIRHAIRGLARAHLGADNSSKPIPVGLLCDPRSKALVTNGRPGHLQFYCMNTDTQLYNVSFCMCWLGGGGGGR